MLRAASIKEITFIGYSTARNSGSSVTCSVPTGSQAGDLLIAFANQTTSTQQITMTPPSGWSETLDTLGYFAGYVAIYDGTTPNYTFTKSGSSSPQVIMVSFRNAEFDVQGAVSSAKANPDAPAVTLSSNNSCVLACFINTQGSYPLVPARSYSTPTNYTEIFDTDNSLAVSYRTGLSAGSSGIVSATATSGTLNRAFLIGLKSRQPTPSNNLVFVGYALEAASTNPTSISLTSLSGGIASSASAGDIVFAVRAFKNATNRTFTCDTSGYTQLADLYANSTNDAQLGVFYKVLTTGETSVQISNSGSVSDGAIGVFVFRGENITNPLDVTSTTATFTSTGRPDCPSITPVTNNSLILAIGSGAGASGNPLSDLTAPSGMSNFYQVRTGAGTDNQTVLGMATFIQTIAGAYNPATFGGGSTSTSNSACAVTIALRKA
jgi:hypothetical protein